VPLAGVDVSAERPLGGIAVHVVQSPRICPEGTDLRRHAESVIKANVGQFRPFEQQMRNTAG